jgi:hypothetical protein
VRERKRERASCGQVEAMPRVIRSEKEEKRKERKGIIKVAFLFLLPDDKHMHAKS